MSLPTLFVSHGAPDLVLSSGPVAAVSDPSRLPQEFALAHPTPEHFLPLLVAWAAGGGERSGRRIHHGFEYGNLGMSCFGFGASSEIRP